MQNFLMSYHYHVDDPFYPELESYYSFDDGVYYEGKIDRYTECKEYFSCLREIRAIIKADLERFFTKCIYDLNNSQALVKELYTLIETMDNGQEYDFDHGQNFFFLTDNYLCFNNYENFFDELELGALGSDAETYETIVIIDRSWRNFYFIRITKKVLAVAESTTINAYSIKDKNVKKRKVNFKREVRLAEYTDEGIKKILSALG